MAAGKEIRTKISSIQSTQKITSAMEMVAASKMRKAQDLPWVPKRDFSNFILTSEPIRKPFSSSIKDDLALRPVSQIRSE